MPITIPIVLQEPTGVTPKEFKELTARALGWVPEALDGPDAYIAHHLQQELNTRYQQGRMMATREAVEGILHRPQAPRGRPGEIPENA